MDMDLLLEKMKVMMKDMMEEIMDRKFDQFREEFGQEIREEIKVEHDKLCAKFILNQTRLEKQLNERLDKVEENSARLERKVDQIYSIVMSEKEKNFERNKRVNKLDNRLEKAEADIMSCQNEIFELKESMV